MLWLDAYERRARLAPGLLALLPVSVVVAVLGLREAPVVTSIIVLFAAAGGPVLLAAYVRDVGLRSQDRLWKQWGGAPTTIALRTRTQPSNQVRRDLWRRAVSSTTKVSLLSADAELADPAAADDAIEVAVARLRDMTRGDAFELVRAENKNYGFHRNVYALRHLGRLLAAMAALSLAAVFAHQWRAAGAASATPDMIIGLAVAIGLLAFWFLGPSDRRVRQAGDKYAEQILYAAAALEAGQPVAPNTTDSSGEK